MYEVVVIGAGPAGLAAGLTLGRARRNALVIDSGRGRNAPADAVHNFLGQDGTPPDELRRIGRKQIAPYASVEIVDAEVDSVTRRDDGSFDIHVAAGDIHAARRLILAMGVTDTLPDIPGLAALWGTAAIHCPYCHGYEFSGRPIAVLGGGDPRAHLALHARRFGSEVTWCTDGADGADGVDVDMVALLESNGIVVRTEAVESFDSFDGVLRAIRLASGGEVRADAVFVPSALSVRGEVGAWLGCSTSEDGWIEVTPFGATSVPGVYAVGDIAKTANLPMPFASVANAAHTGSIAAVAVDKDLLAEDHGLPHPFSV